MMQKLPYKDFQFTTTTLDTILNTPDDSDHGYYIVCDIDYTNECKERTEQLALMSNKKKINDKKKGIKKHNNARHIDYYDALMNNTQRTVDECRIQKNGDKMTTEEQVRLV